MDFLFNMVIAPIEIIFDAIFCYLQYIPGVAIIAISLVMNLLALPLYQRADAIQGEERNKTTLMKHWADHIKKTFKGDERYMMLNEYYRIEGYKPIYALRSIFPLLLQIPFFIAAYHYLSTQALLSGASFLFLKDLGAPDQLLTIGGLTINVLPIVMTLINVISGYIYLRGFPLKDKIQTYGIAAIFLVLLYNSPSGLVFYWTLNQIFSVAKNVFMKLVKDQKIRNIIFAVLGGIFVLFIALLGMLKTRKRVIIAVVIFICCCMPLIVSKVKEKIQDKIKPAKQINPMYFIFGAVFLALFMGVTIPLAVVYSDPAEFVTQVTTPTSLIINNVSIFIGFFIFWLGIYYYLSKTRIRNSFTIAVWLLSGVFLVNYLFFAGNYGIMSNSFVFDEVPVIGKTEMLINLLVLAVVAVVLFIIIKKWKKIIPYIYTILIISCIGLSGFYGINIAKAIAVPEKETKSAGATTDNIADSLALSKNGKNVVVLVLDMAKGIYVPYIFNEKPELKQQFNGFTFYPNTLSYGICTKWGAPGLYGGHEYSPLMLNKREEELNVDKNDEAFSVMPTIFSQNGYNVTVWGTVIAGYGDPEKSSSLFNFDSNIKMYNIDEKYAEPYFEKYGESLQVVRTRSLVHYSLFRVFPLAFRGIIYNNGKYLKTNQGVIYSEGFLNQYASLQALSDITTTNNSDDNNFLMLYNYLPHQHTLLEAPEYEPKENGEINLKNEPLRVINGEILKMDTEKQRSYYDVNMASYLQIGRWLDYLKQQGVYDNTRIIIASDHGWNLFDQIDSLAFGNRNNMNLGALNCVLMMKDFNSSGDFIINNTFMMNADVPTLATQKIIKDPVNPFTGNSINVKAKDHEIVVTNVHNVALNQSEKVFDPSSGSVWRLKNHNIFDKNNWEKLQ